MKDRNRMEEKSWSQQGEVWMGSAPQPCSQDKGQVKVLAHRKVRSILFGQQASHSTVYKTALCFITPSTQAVPGLRSSFKFFTLFSFLLFMFRAKIDFMHYNPPVYAGKEHVPHLTALPGWT